MRRPDHLSCLLAKAPAWTPPQTHTRPQIAPAPAPQHQPEQAQKTIRPESTKLLAVLPTCVPSPRARNLEKAQTAKSILPQHKAVDLISDQVTSLFYACKSNCFLDNLRQVSIREVRRDTKALSSSVRRKRISTFPPLFRPFTLTGNSRASRKRREAWWNSSGVVLPLWGMALEVSPGLPSISRTSSSVFLTESFSSTTLCASRVICSFVSSPNSARACPSESFPSFRRA